MIIRRYRVLNLENNIRTVKSLGEVYLQHVTTETMDYIVIFAFRSGFGRGKDRNPVQDPGVRAFYYLDRSALSEYALKGREAVPPREEQTAQRPHIRPRNVQYITVYMMRFQ